MEALSKRKIFITGINGFTGVHFEKYLRDLGYEVYGSTLAKSNNANHYVCDILNEQSLYLTLNKVKPDYIVHLAAISFVAAENQKYIYDVNIFGTTNLLNVIERLNYKPTKILIASSAAVYGNVEGELSEELCPMPVNHYGNSKLVMENMVRQYFDKQNIIIVRPFNYTGFGQENHFLIPKIVSHFKQNKKVIELGNIDVYREFNNVQFIMKSYSDLFFSSLKSEVLNVCTGQAYNIREILRIMEDIAGYKIEIKVNPNFVRKNEIKILKGSPKKIIKAIGDNSKTFTLEDTLRSMYSHETYLN